MRRPIHLTLHGRGAQVVERMMRAGAVESPEEAVEHALMEHGRRQGLLEEDDVLKGLRAQAKRRPLTDQQIDEGLGRAKRARLL